MEALFAVKSSPTRVVISDVKTFTKTKEEAAGVGGCWIDGEMLLQVEGTGLQVSF